MLTQYNLKMPHAVYGGENAMDNITAIIKARGAKKVAMFTDKGIEGAGLFALPEEAVKASGAEYYVLDELPPEPSYMAVQKLVDEFKVSGADLIVACGGGSVMDAAKLASVLVTDAYGVKELLDNPGMAQKCVPIVLIPTTAGTGAEVTPNAIVAVPEKELKVGIVNENMIADYVILDARMIKNLPRKIAAATGVDALAHCIECFTSNKANPFSDLYALEGLDLILNNIEKACDDPEAMAEKNRMQIAAYYGGLAITASGTTAVHALSYPLGGKYHIAHGVSNAILLAPVMRFNSEHPAVRERLAAAYLSERGLEILEYNYRTARGEIDLIAREKDTLVFVEVKYRRDARMGYPQEAVTPAKQRKIRQVAGAYLAEKGGSGGLACRFDVVAVLGDEITWIPGAF